MAKSNMIPEVSTEKVAELLETIKPLCRKDGKLHYIVPPDPFKTAFTWDPKFLEEATGLKEVAQITTYHTAGYILFFKPSLSEVYAQIAALQERWMESKLPEGVVAFETITSEPEVKMHTHDIPDFYGHSTITKLYARI